jgi:TPR repeat protein
MSVAIRWLLSALILCVIAGAARGQTAQKAPASSQTQAPAPDCTDAVQCATECEKGVGASCYKLGGMYQFGNSGVEKNIARAIEFYLKACDRGNAQACNDAGAAFPTSGSGSDPTRVAELYKRGCTLGDPYACGNLGSLYEQGRGVTKNLPQAVDLLNRACTGGAFFSCVTLGRIYQMGENGPKDDTRAFNLYRQGCDGGNAAGCYDIGLMYLNGAGSAVVKDPKLAVPLLKRACTGGNADSCNDLGVMYDRANGVEKDEVRASALYEKACEGNDSWGCNNLALMYRDGRGVPGDPARAAELFRKGCELGHAGACNDLGVAYEIGRGVAKDEPKAVVLYQKGCDGKDYIACTNLGFMYRDAVGVSKDEGHAVQEFILACDGGDARGCFGVGYALATGKGAPKDEPRAIKLYQKSCDGHYALACNNLGLMVRDGSGIGKDENRSVQLFKAACEAGEANGCSNLGFAYEYARGVSMDEAKAAELYQKACQGSLASGCDNFKRLTQENRSLAHNSSPAQQAQGNPAAQSAVTTRGGATATPMAIKREQWALVVGISKYGTGVEGLRFARKDAEAFYNLLLSPNGGGFPRDHVLKLVDEEATSVRVRGGVRDFLGQAGKDDVVEVFFAGHGAPDPRHPSALYLLTYDTNPDHLGETAFDMDEIRSALERTISAERVIVYVDACHSAGISTLNTRALPNERELLNRYLTTLTQSSPAIAMFSSTETNELSQEGEQWGGGHGVFTYYLLQGLQGAADRDKDGIVTLRELADYVEDNVKAATKNAQHPRLSPSQSWDPNIPLSILH